MENNLLAIVLVICSSFLGAFGSYFFKLGSKNLKTNLIQLLQNYPLLAGFGLFGISSFIYLFALRISKLTILYPLSSLSYVWALFIGYYFLKEKITVLKIIGILLILSGASLVVLSI